VIEVLERLRTLWTQPVDAHDDAAAAFRAVYADPVVVNGAELPVTALVERARMLQRAFDRLDMRILARSTCSSSPAARSPRYGSSPMTSACFASLMRQSSPDHG
jgi:hypothetical protein